MAGSDALPSVPDEQSWTESLPTDEPNLISSGLQENPAPEEIVIIGEEELQGSPPPEEDPHTIEHGGTNTAVAAAAAPSAAAPSAAPAAAPAAAAAAPPAAAAAAAAADTRNPSASHGFFPISPADLARWCRFGERGGIGAAVATQDVLADNEWEDLMMIKGDQVVVLLQFPSHGGSSGTGQEKDLSMGTFLGYCEGVVGKFTGDSVHFLTPKLKKAVISPRTDLGRTAPSKEEPSMTGPEPDSTESLPPVQEAKGTLEPVNALQEVHDTVSEASTSAVEPVQEGSSEIDDHLTHDTPSEEGEQKEEKDGEEREGLLDRESTSSLPAESSLLPHELSEKQAIQYPVQIHTMAPSDVISDSLKTQIPVSSPGLHFNSSSTTNVSRILDTRRMMSRGPSTSSSVLPTTHLAHPIVEIHNAPPIRSPKPDTALSNNNLPVEIPGSGEIASEVVGEQEEKKRTSVESGAEVESEGLKESLASPFIPSHPSRGTVGESGLESPRSISRSSHLSSQSVVHSNQDLQFNRLTNGGGGSGRDHVESGIYDSYYSQDFGDDDWTGKLPKDTQSHSPTETMSPSTSEHPFQDSSLNDARAALGATVRRADRSENHFEDNARPLNELDLERQAQLFYEPSSARHIEYGTASSLRDRLAHRRPIEATLLPTPSLQPASEKATRITSTVYSDLGIPRLNEIFPRSNTADSMSSFLAGSLHSVSTVDAGRSDSPPPFSSITRRLQNTVAPEQTGSSTADFGNEASFQPTSSLVQWPLEHQNQDHTAEQRRARSEQDPFVQRDLYQAIPFTAESYELMPSSQVNYPIYEAYDSLAIPSTPNTSLPTTASNENRLLLTPQYPSTPAASTPLSENPRTPSTSSHAINPDLHTPTVMDSAEVLASRRLFQAYFQAPATSPVINGIIGGRLHVSPSTGVFEGLPPRPPPSPFNYNPDIIRGTGLGLGFGLSNAAAGSSGIEASPRRITRRKSAKGLKISEPQIALQFYPTKQFSTLQGDGALHISNDQNLHIPSNGLRVPPSPSSTLNSPSTPTSMASDRDYPLSVNSPMGSLPYSEGSRPSMATRLPHHPSLGNLANTPSQNGDHVSSAAATSKLRKMRSKSSMNTINNENLSARSTTTTPNSMPNSMSTTLSTTAKSRKEEQAFERYGITSPSIMSDITNPSLATNIKPSAVNGPGLPSRPSMKNLFGAKRKTSQSKERGKDVKDSSSTVIVAPASLPRSKGISNKDFEDETVQLGNGIEFEIIKPLAIAMLGASAGAGNSSPASGSHGDDISLNSATTTDSPHTPSSEMPPHGGPFSPRSFYSPTREQWDNSHFDVALITGTQADRQRKEPAPKSQEMSKSSSNISVNRLIPAINSVTNDEGSVQDHRDRELRWIQTMQTIPPKEAKGSKKLRSLVQAGVPSSVRGRVWSYLIESETFRVEGLFHTLCGCDRITAYDAIDVEVRQTYADYPNFEACSVSEADLCSVLQALAQYDSRIGSAPGLAPTVGLLLSHMPAEEVFWIMVALLRSYGFENFLDSEKESLRIDGFTFCLILESHDSKLFKRLCQRDIDISRLYHSWCRTLFLSALPWPTALRVVDQLFFAPSLQTTVALAILDQVRSRILSDEFSSHESLRHFLNNLEDSSSRFSSSQFIPKLQATRVKDGLARKARKRAEAGVH